MDCDHPLDKQLSSASVEAAVNFVEVCNERTAVAVLLDKKKFRIYGHKPGALRGFNVLKEDKLGTLEHALCRSWCKEGKHLMNPIDLTINTSHVMHLRSCTTGLFLPMTMLKIECNLQES